MGRALLSDLDPVITAPSIPNMAEGTGATGLSFVLTDDTSENGLPPLSATVSVNFNGNVVQTNASCLVGTPQGGEVTRRNCTFDIPVFDQHFATDAVAGTYAPNVSASVTIVATDGRENNSMTATRADVTGAIHDSGVAVVMLGGLFSTPSDLQDLAGDRGVYFYTPFYSDARAQIASFLEALGSLTKINMSLP